MRVAFAFIAVLTVAVHTPALAQSIDASPNYGTIHLSEGFMPDPRVISVTPGGRTNARDASGENCSGVVARAPDVWLIYRAGRSPLILSVASESDTTLVVRAPDGLWHCDDDGGSNRLNPAVTFRQPVRGRYSIWIVSDRAGVTPARLHISEISSQ